MTDLAGSTKNAKKLLPTGQVLGVMGLRYRTLYNYLRDFGEYFSESARTPKKGKRWTPDDLSVIQTIRHLHSERQSKETIKESLAEGYKPPLEGGYKPEDVNRLIESSWLLLGQAEEMQAETKKLFQQCTFCEWDVRYRIKDFYKTIFRYEEFEHELNQIKLIVGRISDSHKARQMRDEEYERLHKWIRYHFLAEEERRLAMEEEKQEVLDGRKEITNWVKGKLLSGGKKHTVV